MPLNDVIKAVTMTPAIAFRRGNAIGSLNVNHAADITVLHFEEFDMDLEDCNAQLRKVKRRFVPVAVWKHGVSFKTSEARPFPNEGKLQELASLNDALLIKDEFWIFCFSIKMIIDSEIIYQSKLKAIHFSKEEWEFSKAPWFGVQ